MITQHMLARPFERHEAPIGAREITLRSRALARAAVREREAPAMRPEAATPSRPRVRKAWAWARALSV